MNDERQFGVVKEYPRTWAEFEAWFPDDESCLNYLARLRWPNGFVCPSCGPTRAWIKSRGRLVCSNCRRETTVTAGTLFDGTHKPLRTWFTAIWHIADRPAGLSAREFQQMLGLGSYKTAWIWLRKLQRAMSPRGMDLLAGIVEMDDFRLPSKGAGFGDTTTASGTIVVIAVETKGRLLGRTRIANVSNLNRDTLTEFVRTAVEPEAIVCTDDFDGYSGLETAGYRRQVVRTPKDSNNSQTSFASVRQVAQVLAIWLQMAPVGPLSPQTLDYRLDEFTFRFNHREASEGAELFRVLLAEIAKGNEGKGRRLPADV